MLEVYGPALYEYEGKGWLHHKEGGRSQIEFKCIQLNDARIIIYANIKSGGLSFTPDDNGDFFSASVPNIKGVTGTLDDGRYFRTVSNVWGMSASINVTPSSVKAEMLIGAFKIEVFKNKSEAEYEVGQSFRMIFPLTNLMFDETGFIEGGDGSFIPVLQLENLGLEVLIVKESNYKELLEQMQATNLCTITSFVEVKCENKNKDEVIEVVNNLCALLAFANGARITWVCYQVISEDDKVDYAFHRMAITHNYSAALVIDPRIENELKVFIEATYNNYVAKKDSYNLQKVIETIVQSKSGDGFSELSGLNICSAVDVLKGRWAKQVNYQHNLIDKNVFKNIKALIEDTLNKFIESNQDISEETIKPIKYKLGDINNPSFTDVLRSMVKAINAAISDDEISLFVKTRNELTHQARFKTENYREELYRIYSIADQLLFALLGYTGRYFHMQQRTRIENMGGIYLEPEL